MTDGAGLVQFLSGLDEIARGAKSPSTLPVWQRELLCSRDPLPFTLTKGTPVDMVHKSLFFTTTEISALRKLVLVHLQCCTTFDVLTACLWHCRTIALQTNPEDEMPIIWAFNARKMFNPPLPVGYYGNVLAFPAAISTARDLCNKPFAHALELVMKTKSDVTKEYIRSVSDLNAINGRYNYAGIRPYLVSDLTRVGFDEIDLGWGKATYGGVCKGGVAPIPGLSSFYIPYTNNKGESGIVILICLPNGVMDRFVKEINNMLVQAKDNEVLLEHVLLEHELPALSKL
ncbi:putative benzyl alcohol O-benzoyltransferase [Helianthus annuus]|nr:putative benzyl alcohol O-benzoyltransferase [Helianthus annuus]